MSIRYTWGFENGSLSKYEMSKVRPCVARPSRSTMSGLFRERVQMKKTLAVLITVMELCADNLNIERDHEYAITNSLAYDEFIALLGSVRMVARQMLEDVKYEGAKE